MKKASNKLDIMNLLGDAADQKSRMNVQPEDEEDSLNSKSPGAKKPPQSIKKNQVAAIKAKNAGKGKMIPNQNQG